MLVDSGRSDLLKVVVGGVAVDTYNMGLFTNNHTIVEGTVLTDLTEVSVSGYARQALTGFGGPTGPVGGVWTSTAGNVTFTNSSGSPVTIYGWFYVGNARAVFYGGGNFGTALTLPAGGTLVFSPAWNDTTN